MSTILIADDNAENLYLARYLLENAGHSVQVAHNGEEAVSAVQQNPDFDLILMDVQMPILDGLEATKRIKANGSMTPIVALTAKAMAGDRDLILASGCDGYIEKPFDVEMFLSQINQHLL